MEEFEAYINDLQEKNKELETKNHHVEELLAKEKIDNINNRLALTKSI